MSGLLGKGNLFWPTVFQSPNRLVTVSYRSSSISHGQESDFPLSPSQDTRSTIYLHPNNELFADSILHQGYAKAFLFIQHKDAKVTDLLAMYVFLNRIFTGFFFLSKEEKSLSVLGNLNVSEGQGQHSSSSESSYRRQHPEVSAVPSNYYPTLYRNLT